MGDLLADDFCDRVCNTQADLYSVNLYGEWKKQSGPEQSIIQWRVFCCTNIESSVSVGERAGEEREEWVAGGEGQQSVGEHPTPSSEK